MHINTYGFQSNYNRALANGIREIGLELKILLGNDGGWLLAFSSNTPHEFCDMG